MIFKKTTLYTADNSGIRTAMCIGILKRGFSKTFAIQASHVIVSVKRFTPNKKVKKGSILHGVIIQAVGIHFSRVLGHNVRWASNRLIALKKNDSVPLSSRVTHFVTFQLRGTSFTRIISLARGIL